MKIRFRDNGVLYDACLLKAHFRRVGNTKKRPVWVILCGRDTEPPDLRPLEVNTAAELAVLVHANENEREQLRTAGFGGLLDE
jgi:hypothetical protein